MSPVEAAAPPKPAFPFLDLKAQFAPIREEVMAAVARVMESQQFIMGPDVAALEQEFEAYTGSKHAVACASGSDALLLCMMALDVGAGDEVIIPPFTFVATAGAVARLGARPVFADIDPITFNLDAKKLEALITPRTRAIIPVHLFGLCADLDPILEIARKHKVPVIEDAAQAIGAKYHGRQAGSIGDFGCFSFFPSKNLGGAGDGGMITVNDTALRDKLKILRDHGSPRQYEYQYVGVNSRLDSLQAAILRVKFRYLDQWAAGRRRNAKRYAELFAEYGLAAQVKLPVELAQHFHIYNQYTIRVARRDQLQQHLKQAGIPTAIYYPHSLHLQPAFSGLGYPEGSFPETERACREVLSLPIYPELKEEQLRSVAQSIAGFYGGRSSRS
jgi:dTDP-4-amino-4,6-dideoxygalactose transaminase